MWKKSDRLSLITLAIGGGVGACLGYAGSYFPQGEFKADANGTLAIVAIVNCIIMGMVAGAVIGSHYLKRYD